MPLGHKLRADDDVGPAACDLLDLGLQRAGRTEQVRRQDRNPRIGKPIRHLLGQPLHPRADGGKAPHGLTMRAGLGHGRAVAALVADKTFQEPMLDHARVALVASDLMAAGAADGDGRIAPAVQEQERLFPPLDAGRNQRGQRPG